VKEVFIYIYEGDGITSVQGYKTTFVPEVGDYVRLDNQELKEEFEKETGWKKERNQFMNAVIISSDNLRYEGIAFENGKIAYHKAFSEWMAENLMEARKEADAHRKCHEAACKSEVRLHEEVRELKQELERVKETVLDIINSENSGLSAEQRLSEIKKELQHIHC